MSIPAVSPWLLAALAFFIPLETAPVNLLMALVLLAVLLEKPGRQALLAALGHPVVALGFALVAWLMLTLMLHPGQLEPAQNYLGKTLRILMLPVLAAAAANSPRPWLVTDAFAAGVLLSVLGSYGVASGLLTPLQEGGTPLYFKLHITHNFFVALAAPYLVWRAWVLRAEAPSWLPAVLLLAALLMLWNMLVMVPGRSGWLALAAVVAVAAVAKLRLRSLAVCGLVGGLLAVAVFLGVDVVNQRIMEVVSEVQGWLAGDASASTTSNGRRLSFWLLSFLAWADAPLLGHGLGGFEAAIAPHAAEQRFFLFDNPHNQYLLYAVQGGAVALVLFVAWLMAAAWAGQGQKRLLLLALVFAYALLNLLNSFHYDFAESVLFILAVASLGQFQGKGWSSRLNRY